MMSNIFLRLSIGFLILLGFTNCTNCRREPKNEITNYNNILIYSDLSSRMDKNPNDKILINELLTYFEKECVKPGEKIGDNSSINFSKINAYNTNCETAKIDLTEIEKVEDKQAFVNNKSKDNLKKRLKEFSAIVNCNYQEKDKGGLDILSLLHGTINEGNSIKQPIVQALPNGDKYTKNFINHMFLFTDGYLEYNTDGIGKKYYFGSEQIESVREFCIKNNVSPEKAIENVKNHLKLTPLRSENNKLINLYILETDDRGFNKQQGTQKNSGPLSDNNILQAAWKIWAKESGFKNFVWKQTSKSSTIAKDYIQQLIVK